MYELADAIIKAAAVVSALGVIGGVVFGIFRMVERDKKQSNTIKEIQSEQTIICYALKGALQGLIESGCNGPCKDALNMLDKHLNKKAHNQPER